MIIYHENEFSATSFYGNPGRRRQGRVRPAGLKREIFYAKVKNAKTEDSREEDE